MSDKERLLKIYGKKYSDFLFLAQGTFGRVYKAKFKEGTEFVAIKNNQVVDIKQEHIKYMRTEIDILYKNLGNQNIIKIISHREEEHNIYIVLEVNNYFPVQQYCQITLNDYNKKYYGNRMPEDCVITFIRQIINGLRGIHNLRIIHRDLKLENIMVCLKEEEWDQLQKGNKKSVPNPIFKIIDFGVSKELSLNQDLTDTYAGTRLTMGICYLTFYSSLAPEILEGQNYGFEADIYSLGVILYLLVTGNYPYTAGFGQTQEKVIKQQKADFTAFTNPRLADLIRKMLKYNPGDRIALKDIESHPFFYSSVQKKQIQVDQDIKTNKIYSIAGSSQSQGTIVFQQQSQQKQDLSDLESKNSSNSSTVISQDFVSNEQQGSNQFIGDDWDKKQYSDINHLLKTIIQSDDGKKELETIIMQKIKYSRVLQMTTQAIELFLIFEVKKSYSYNKEFYTRFLRFMILRLNIMYEQAKNHTLAMSACFPQNSSFKILHEQLHQDSETMKTWKMQVTPKKAIQENLKIEQVNLTQEEFKVQIKKFYKDVLLFALESIDMERFEVKDLKLNIYICMLYTINAYVFYLDDRLDYKLMYDLKRNWFDKQKVVDNPELLMDQIHKQMREYGGISLE